MVAAFLIVWVLAMISLPILKWVLGEQALPVGISVGVLLQAMAVLSILIWTWGSRRTWVAAGVILVCAWGSNTSATPLAFPLARMLIPNFYSRRSAACRC